MARSNAIYVLFVSDKIYATFTVKKECNNFIKRNNINLGFPFNYVLRFPDGRVGEHRVDITNDFIS
jgi:hypothetical protein